jgi:hypothetical protein
MDVWHILITTATNGKPRWLSDQTKIMERNITQQEKGITTDTSNVVDDLKSMRLRERNQTHSEHKQLLGWQKYILIAMIVPRYVQWSKLVTLYTWKICAFYCVKIISP